MNISYNWLRRYLDTSLTAEQISVILTDIGLEVEGFEKIETIRGGLKGVVVGEVLTCVDHPDSDHLHITTVDVGSGEPLQIVCGAANCRAGLKVLCATVGSVLYPNGGEEEFKIKRSRIRGVESLGMLCAEDELGVGSSHAGIMELPADAVARQGPNHRIAVVLHIFLDGVANIPNLIARDAQLQAYKEGFPGSSDKILRLRIGLPHHEGVGSVAVESSQVGADVDTH